MFYNAGLYIAVVLIWGSTWLSIKYQVNEVAAIDALFYRFAIAAILTQCGLLLFRRFKNYPITLHGWFVILGLSLFCINYYLFYVVTGMGLTTGLIAVIFSSLTVMNMLNARLFFKEKTTRLRIAGTVVGITGISIVFREDIASLLSGQGSGYGLLICIVATYIASLGNMAAKYLQQQKVNVLNANGWGMTYGAMALGLFAWLTPEPFTFSTSVTFVGNLIYLSVFGSILAFWFYITLMGRIGSERAAYSTLLFPLVALWLSWMFEGFVWTQETVIGFGLVLLGNFMVIGWLPRSRVAA